MAFDFGNRVKLANSGTYDRMDSTLFHLARLVLDPQFTIPNAPLTDTPVPTESPDDSTPSEDLSIAPPASLEEPEPTLEGDQTAILGGTSPQPPAATPSIAPPPPRPPQRIFNKPLIQVLLGLKQPSLSHGPVLESVTTEAAGVEPWGDGAAVQPKAEMNGEARGEVEKIKFFDETLNDSQRAAVEFALRSEEVACIHGPPGVSTLPAFACRTGVLTMLLVGEDRLGRLLHLWRSLGNWWWYKGNEYSFVVQVT